MEERRRDNRRWKKGGERATTPARWVAVAPPSAIMVEGRDQRRRAGVAGDHDTVIAAVSKLCSAAPFYCRCRSCSVLPPLFFAASLSPRNLATAGSTLKQGNGPHLDLDGDVLDGKVSKQFGDIVIACGFALEFPKVSVRVEDSVAKKVIEEEEEAVALGVVMEIRFWDIVGVAGYDVMDGAGVEVDGGLGGGVAEHVGGPVKEAVAVVDELDMGEDDGSMAALAQTKKENNK
ncbi:hypothetical protein PIB30_038007 [Stylosanthes scabra]|uniref:Uncharacterized protein n=1 Tax=Stylosanthes scabra TaxID=79078 RepID=A0ABU6RDX4_9FABA|nr:hypothetical protein [Stylosanthes scabra]